MATTKTKTDPQTDRTPRLASDEAILAMVGRVTDTALEQENKSGSLGYHFVGKASAEDGVRYQVDVRLTRIGTKTAG